MTHAILDKCKPSAGTPADCMAAIEEYRDAGRTRGHGWVGSDKTLCVATIVGATIVGVGSLLQAFGVL